MFKTEEWNTIKILYTIYINIYIYIYTELNTLLEIRILKSRNTNTLNLKYVFSTELRQNSSDVKMKVLIRINHKDSHVAGDMISLNLMVKTVVAWRKTAFLADTP